MSVKHDNGDLWVFGYGSLMWRPGFPYAERHAARLVGYHRALCLYSHGYRGTPEKPGLVLGLDRGGSCVGVAFRVAAADVAATRAYLVWREGTQVYREARIPLSIADGRRIEALAFVVKRAHPHYAGRLSPRQLLALARQGQGNKGSCRDYVVSTHEHLVSLGVRDATLAWLAHRLGAPVAPIEDQLHGGLAEVESVLN